MWGTAAISNVVAMALKDIKVKWILTICSIEPNLYKVLFQHTMNRNPFGIRCAFCTYSLSQFGLWPFPSAQRLPRHLEHVAAVGWQLSKSGVCFTLAAHLKCSTATSGSWLLDENTVCSPRWAHAEGRLVVGEALSCWNESEAHPP